MKTEELITQLIEAVDALTSYEMVAPNGSINVTNKYHLQNVTHLVIDRLREQDRRLKKIDELDWRKVDAERIN